MPRTSTAPWTRANAQRLRRAPTEVEQRLWWKLRELNKLGAGFRRQASIGPYIADFAWLSARVVIELDGGQHAEATRAHDEARDRWLRERGFRVLRFWNADVTESLDGVVEVIFHTVRDSLNRPHPTRSASGPPTPRGGGKAGGEAGDRTESDAVDAPHPTCSSSGPPSPRGGGKTPGEAEVPTESDATETSRAKQRV